MPRSDKAYLKFNVEIRQLLLTQNLVHWRIRYIKLLSSVVYKHHENVMDLAAANCRCFDIGVVESSISLS